MKPGGLVLRLNPKGKGDEYVTINENIYIWASWKNGQIVLTIKAPDQMDIQHVKSSWSRQDLEQKAGK